MSALEVDFDFALPPTAEGFSSGASSTARLLVLSWNQVVLYPDRPRPDELTVAASLKLPEDWKFATAPPSYRHFAVAAQTSRRAWLYSSTRFCTAARRSTSAVLVLVGLASIDWQMPSSAHARRADELDLLRSYMRRRFGIEATKISGCAGLAARAASAACTLAR